VTGHASAGLGFAWPAQEAESIFCTRSLIKTSDWILEGPPHALSGLSFCADHVAVHESAFGTKRTFAASQ
jgi:hypothetical protein